MSCFYFESNLKQQLQNYTEELLRDGIIHSTLSGVIEGNTAEDLRILLLALKQNNTILANLDFYSADSATQVSEATSKGITQYNRFNGHGGVRVTQFIENNFSLKFLPTVTTNIVKDFQTWEGAHNSKHFFGFGSYVHKFMELSGNLRAQLELINNGFTADNGDQYMSLVEYIDLFITEKFNKLSVENKEAFARAYPDLYGFLVSYLTAQKGDIIYNLEASLNTISNIIARKYSGYSHVSEMKLGAQTVNGALIGTTDALYYNDQEAVLLDFKTSVTGKDITSPVTKKHYIQLCCYRKMLEKLGIKLPIDIYNIQMNLSKNGTITLSNDGTNHDGFINMDETLSLKEFEDVFTVLTSLFPDTIDTITEEKQILILLKTFKQFKRVCDSDMFWKKEQKILEKVLEDHVTNGTKYYSDKYKALCDVTKEGNLYVLTYTKNKEEHQAYKDTIENIAFAETESALKNIYANTSQLRQLIGRRNKEALRSYIRYRTDAQSSLMLNLFKYTSNAWTVEINPALEKMGVITVKNIDGTRDFIITTRHSKLNYSDKNHRSLIAKVTDETFDGMPQHEIGSAMTLEGLLAIINYANEIDEPIKIGEVKTLSITNGTTEQIIDINRYIQAIKLLEKHDVDTFKGVTLIIESKLKFKPQLTMLYEELDDCMKIVNAENKKSFELQSGFNELDVAEKIKALLELKNKVKKSNPALFKDNIVELSYEHPIQVLVGNIDYLIALLQGLIVNQNRRVTKDGFTWQDTGRFAWELLKGGIVNKYTDEGTIISGFAAGLDTSTVYNNPDALLNEAQKMMMAHTLTMKQELVRECEDVNEATLKYFLYMKDSKIFSFVDPLVGDHRSWYLPLLQETPDKKIKPLLLFKNPFAGSNLNKYLKDYIEVLLWALNKYRIPNLDAKYRRMSWAIFKKSDKFLDYVSEINSDEKYLQLPLKESLASLDTIRANVADFIHGNKSAKRIGKDFVLGIKRRIEPKKLASESRDEELKQMDRLRSYNQYEISATTRNDKITEYPDISHWELNLNYLINDFTYAKVRQDMMEKVLPMVGNAIGALSIILTRTGIDLRPLMEALMNRTKISIYNSNLVDPEHLDMVSIVGFAKQIVSIAKIGLRPLLFGKEILVGRLKNTSTIAAGLLETSTGNKITMGMFLKAEGIALAGGLNSGIVSNAIGKNKMGEFNLLELINNNYAITDRDSTVMSEAISVDRYGIFNVGERALFYNTVRPDWYNRMSLFTAMMIADGTWEAHELKNGKMVYNMRNDARFKEYYLHKNDPSYSSPEFLKQKALYEFMLNKFLQAGVTNKDRSPLKLGDDLPMAYTPELISSIKELIGMLYGMYDHEEKTAMLNRTWWNMFMHFMTYLPGDIHKYFMKRGLNSIGRYEHLKEDSSGKPLYYEDDLGLIITTEPKNEDGTDRKPVIGFAGSQALGLAVSALSVIGKICHGKFKEVKENKLELREAGICLFNLLWGTLFAALILALITNGKESEDMSFIANTSVELIRKSALEMSMYNSIISPIDNLNIAGTSALKSFAGDLISMWSHEDEHIYNVLCNNINLLSDFSIGNERN